MLWLVNEVSFGLSANLENAPVSWILFQLSLSSEEPELETAAKFASVYNILDQIVQQNYQAFFREYWCLDSMNRRSNKT